MKEREPFEFVWDLESIRFFWQAQPVRDLGFFTDKRVSAFLRLFRRYGPKAPARVLEIGPGSGWRGARPQQAGQGMFPIGGFDD